MCANAHDERLTAYEVGVVFGFRNSANDYPFAPPPAVRSQAAPQAFASSRTRKI